jgi:cytochrome c-type biogenesis protein CcmH/NrfG
MGFGLQRWIYAARPRKAFSKERKAAGDYIPEYHAPDMHVNVNTQRTTEDLDWEIMRMKKKIRHKWVVDRFLGGGLLIVILAFLFYLASTLFSFTDFWVTDELKERSKKKSGYELCIVYGNRYLEAGEYENAVAEYRNALQLKPNDRLSTALLAKAYYYSCLNKGTHCAEALSIYNNMIANDSTEELLKARAAIYIQQQDFDKADKDLKLVQSLKNGSQIKN